MTFSSRIPERATILFLDLGTSTGWAVGRVGEAPPLCGTWVFDRRCDGWGDQLAGVADTVWEAIKHHQVDILGYETVVNVDKRGWDSTMTLIGFAAVVEMLAFRAGIMLNTRHLSAIRSRFVRRTKGVKGTKDSPGIEIKDVVMGEAIKRGCVIDSHNAADACAGWYFEEQQTLLTVAGYRKR